MTFVQTEFLAFFAILFALYWGVPNRRWQNVLLTVASAIFYGWVHPFWLVLMYTAALLDFGAGLAIERWPKHRKLTLGVSLGANLALLGYYKYCDFFVENVAAALDLLGVQHSMAPLGILLPAGISFYTFQSMAYSIDVYRGELKPRKNLGEYLLAVSFFAHLVAGPVQRASNLLQQAESERKFDLQMVRSGFALAMWGAFKKICVADTVSPYVDKIFSVAEPSTPMIVAGTLGFTVQILADFSGYTDIARGVARMLGWELMENFRSPYVATSPSDFWRRWHISFSTWIRDYVYFTFGGSRGTRLRTTLATLGAMLISGLWHGAAWNFVLWGAYHGVITVAYREVQPRLPKALRELPGGHYAAVALMFGFTVFGWYLFRETSLARIAATLSRDPFASTQEQWITTAVMLAITAFAATPLVLAHVALRWVLPRIEKSDWYLPVQTTAWAAFALGMFVFVRMSATDFIYFQF
ncbi:MAG: MBOAT family O-acyltransferase [Myxococcota bacterium]